MKKRGALILSFVLALAISACAQHYDSTFSPDSFDTSFLHQVNYYPTGYISGNEGVNIQSQGFVSIPGQKQIFSYPGGLDNMAVAIEIKKTHIGFTGMVGEGANRPNLQPYCEAWAAANLGPGVVTQPSVIYYQEKYQMLGFFATVPVSRLSFDLRVMVGRESWYSPDGAFYFTSATQTIYQNFSGINVVSWCWVPGIGIRCLFFERFAAIINADMVDGFNKGAHIVQYNVSGGVAYEL